MEYLLSQTGSSLQGALNYYRTTRLRFEEEQAGRSTTSNDEAEIHPSATIAPGLPFTYKKDLPVLHLRGANDITSPERSLETARKVLPWGKFITYEGAGHWLMLEKKDKVIRDVLDWLTDMRLKSKL
jgi:pimeloyl-ACP methyl ester carboxylesterase